MRHALQKTRGNFVRPTADYTYIIHRLHNVLLKIKLLKITTGKSLKFGGNSQPDKITGSTQLVFTPIVW